MKPLSFRRGLLQVHLWIGLVLSLPLVIIGLTGSFLLLQRESLAFAVPSATAIGEAQPIEKMIEAARTFAPQGSRVGRVEFPARKGAPAIVQFELGERPQQAAVVYIDPVSLALLGGPERLARGPMMQSVQQLHEFLWLPPITGLKVVGWIGVAMTFMGLSGLVLWWPRGSGWRTAFTVRRGARGLRLHLELHHMAGFWGSAVFLILSVSGIYLCFPETVSTAVQAVSPGRTARDDLASSYVPPAAPLDAARAIAAARSAVTNANPVALQMPDRPGRPLLVYMEQTDFGPTTPPIIAVLNPETAELIYVDDPRTYSLGEKFLNFEYALHFGLGLGTLWKVVVFVSGLLPLLLAITGVSIWWMKRRVRVRAPSPAQAAPAPAE